MSFEVSFRNLNPREEVKKRAQALYAKLDRFLDPAADSVMTIAVEHNQAIVELVVTSHGVTFKAIEEDPELKAALDKCFHTIEDQLRRNKDKRTDKKGRGEGADGFVEEGDEGPAL